MNIIFHGLFIGSLIVTSYRSVPSQTDQTPYHTSTNERVSPDGVAISRDLLCGACRKAHKRCGHPEYRKKLHYGDWVYIEEVGFKRVFDCMNKRHKNRADVWVRSFKDEKAFHKKFGHKKLKVWVLKGINAR